MPAVLPASTSPPRTLKRDRLRRDGVNPVGEDDDDRELTNGNIRVVEGLCIDHLFSTGNPFFLTPRCPYVKKSLEMTVKCGFQQSWCPPTISNTSKVREGEASKTIIAVNDFPGTFNSLTWTLTLQVGLTMTLSMWRK